MRCKYCGRDLSDTEMVYVINEGMPDAFHLCGTCGAYEADNGHIISCEACGRYFSVEALHDEELDSLHIFTPCPVCGRDVVEGDTREELKEYICTSSEEKQVILMLHIGFDDEDCFTLYRMPESQIEQAKALIPTAKEKWADDDDPILNVSFDEYVEQLFKEAGIRYEIEEFDVADVTF